MRTNSRSSKFKKDVKRQQKRGRQLDKLTAVMSILIDDMRAKTPVGYRWTAGSGA